MKSKYFMLFKTAVVSAILPLPNCFGRYLEVTVVINRLAVDMDIYGYNHGYYAGTFFN